MSSITAIERVRRLLNLIPWVESRGSQGASLEQLSVDFDYPVEVLVDDLTQVVNFVTGDRYGLYGALVFDVAVANGRVWINRNDLLGGPLNVDRVELATAVAAGRALVGQLPGDASPEELGPLPRAVAKLSAALGTEASAVEVHLMSMTDGHLEVIQQSLAEGRCLDLDYYSYGRDEESTRTVQPHRCFLDRFWYLIAYCQSAEAERSFRLDRIRGLRISDQTFIPPRQETDVMDGIPTDGSLPEVVLRLQESARWVLEQYPNRGITEVDGGVDVVLPVTTTRWLERLLLRLGPAAEIRSAPKGLGEDLRTVAARRVLALYD
ncbi:MAG: WYL domain-containing protein [Acidimicrobiales bacterium]|nr:WYL domain-containing protein [Acidimicrobiales bacterium]